MKFWKKGTLHMTFKDEKVWEQFNIMAAKGKNWLPENYKEKQPVKKQSKPKTEKVDAFEVSSSTNDNGQVLMNFQINTPWQ
ncbi:MAG: hypothetical protein ABII90_08110, partial [Bacteroidota bacterium]